MTEWPIPFNAEMVRAILAGRKRQTRRVVKPQPPDGLVPQVGVYSPIVVDRHGIEGPGAERFGAFTEDWDSRCPYGQPGDRLWCKETFQFRKGADAREKYIGTDMEPLLGPPPHYAYRATEPDWGGGMFKWRPSIHMPRHASRITLEVTGVRVQRVQDISREDALAEGSTVTLDGDEEWFGFGTAYRYGSPVSAFHYLWDSIHGTGAWERNDWVWVIGFQPVEVKRG